MKSVSRGLWKVVEVAVVLIVLAGVASVLLSTLRAGKVSALRKSLQSEAYWAPGGPPAGLAVTGGATQDRTIPPARVKTYKAKVDLTPRLSVGTAEPESIYEACFAAEIEADNPDAPKGDCLLTMPLPPEIISLSDLKVTVNGEPSDALSLSAGALVWRGRLTDSKPAKIDVAYTAVGKGIYTLNTPPGRIIDLFEAVLTARKTNLKLLQLSLQPGAPRRADGNTTYTWKYQRLMFGRPIAVDVLGIAPMDRLGELTWLGPLSVLLFGSLVALAAMAYRPARLDKWMLLLIVGTFTGAYPLMYFAQEFMSLPAAIVGACAAVGVIIGLRAVTLLGAPVGLLGVVALAAAAFALTIWATLEPPKQGLIVTGMVLGTFVLAMALLPKARRSLMALAPPPAEANDATDDTTA